MKCRASMFLLMALSFAVLGRASATVYVSASGDNTTGNSWATAYNSIQAGVDAAAERGEDVWVAAGVYPVSSPVQLRSQVAVYGGFPQTGNPVFENRDPVAFVTTLDGQGAVPHVLSCSSVSDIRVDGFTITGGSTSGSGTDREGGGIYGSDMSGSNIIANCTITGNASVEDGGGLFCTAATIEITRCVISSNSCTHFGGGCAFRNNSVVVITGCAIRNNTAHSEGGGIETQNTTLTLTGSTISANVADYFGGGFRCYESTPTLADCEVSGNSSPGPGAGVATQEGGPTTITRCTISGNTSSGGGDGVGIKSHSNTALIVSESTISGNTGGGIGGGISAYGTPVTVSRCVITDNAGVYGGGLESHETSSVRIENTLIAGNVATFSGGGVQVWDNPSEIVNCTIVGNSAPKGGGILAHTPVDLTNVLLAGNTHQAVYEDESGSEATVENCLFYNNPDGHFFDLDTETVYTEVGGPAGLDANVPEAQDNIENDPHFVDAATGNYHVTLTSACIDRGANEDAPADDLDGNPRPYDVPRIAGGGLANAFDIGCYEYIIRADDDTDGDGYPDFIELTWGYDPLDPDNHPVALPVVGSVVVGLLAGILMALGIAATARARGIRLESSREGATRESGRTGNRD